MNLTKFFLYLTFITFFALGQQSYITSSEFWPIYASKNYLFFDDGWSSLMMKPLFNFGLFLVHLIPLNDVQHIQFVKFIFALNGTLQIYLIYLILKKLINGAPWAPLIGTLIITISPYYLTHFFSVRSDQLALTAFFVFIYFNLIYLNFRSAWNIFFLILFPMIGFKHIYFSIFALCLLNLKHVSKAFNKDGLYEKIILGLIVFGTAIWTANLALRSADYFIQTVHSPNSSIIELVTFLRIEFLYVFFSLGSFLDRSFRKYLEKMGLQHLWIMQIVIVLIVLIHPQKFSFFLASLSPIFYMTGVLFLFYMSEQSTRSRLIALSLTLLVSVGTLVWASSQMPVITSNKLQLQTILKISKVVKANKLTYLDGMGILPRQINTGCFVSPDDFESNLNCINQLKHSVPSAVIVTNRLTSVSHILDSLTLGGYTEVGPNFYVKKQLADVVGRHQWAPPAVLFGARYQL